MSEDILCFVDFLGFAVLLQWLTLWLYSGFQFLVILVCGSCLNGDVSVLSGAFLDGSTVG